MDDDDYSRDLNRGWERKFLISNRVWWITGISLFALTLGFWNYNAISRIREEARDNRKRGEIRSALESLEGIDDGIDVRGDRIMSFLENRKELTFHADRAQREPVLLKRFFGGREKVRYDGNEYELDEVVSVSYSPDKERGAMLCKVGWASDYHIVVFNTQDDLNAKVADTFGKGVSGLSWQDDDTLLFMSDLRKHGYKTPIIWYTGDVDENNILGEISEHNEK